MESRSGLRLDQRHMLRCAAPRSRGIAAECATPIARPLDGALIIRCRNCHVDHVFRLVNGEILWDPAPSVVTKGACLLPVESHLP